jgi:hypothetical protein
MPSAGSAVGAAVGQGAWPVLRSRSLAVSQFRDAEINLVVLIGRPFRA